MEKHWAEFLISKGKKMNFRNDVFHTLNTTVRLEIYRLLWGKKSGHLLKKNNKRNYSNPYIKKLLNQNDQFLTSEHFYETNKPHFLYVASSLLSVTGSQMPYQRTQGGSFINCGISPSTGRNLWCQE